MSLQTDEEQTEPSSMASGEEAIATISSKPRPKHPMEALLKSTQGSSRPRSGEIVEGIVLERRAGQLFVDLGPRGIGIVYGREYFIAQALLRNLNVGDPLSVKVVESENDQGYVELSLREVGEEKRWNELKRLKQEGVVLELPVLEANRGGLILEAQKVKGFLPASQLSAQHYPRVEGGDKERIFQELQRLVGTPLRVKVLDVDPREGKLIFSEKELDLEALRARLSSYKVGDEVEGEITGVVDFGAFLRFDESGLEGLIHISEIDWTLVEDPRHVLKVGERVRAKIIEIQGDRVALSLKALKPDPWLKIADEFGKGDRVKGRVVKFSSFGAFVELSTHPIQGLVHISEFGTESRMRGELALGKEYEFAVLMMDPKEHRLSLGMVRKETAEKEAV